MLTSSPAPASFGTDTRIGFAPSSMAPLNARAATKARSAAREREFIDNLLVRIHLRIEMTTTLGEFICRGITAGQDYTNDKHSSRCAESVNRKLHFAGFVRSGCLPDCKARSFPPAWLGSGKNVLGTGKGKFYLGGGRYNQLEEPSYYLILTTFTTGCHHLGTMNGGFS